MSKQGQRILEDWMIDLAILWIDNEGLTAQEVVERLVSFYGEEVRVNSNAVTTRVKRRRRNLMDGKSVKSPMTQPDSLSETDLLKWYQYILYNQIYISHSKNEPKETQDAIRASLAVMNAKNKVADSGGKDINAMKFIVDAIHNEALN